MYNEKYLDNLIRREMEGRDIDPKSIIQVELGKNERGKREIYKINIIDYIEGKDFDWKTYGECYEGVNDLIQQYGGTVKIIPKKTRPTKSKKIDEIMTVIDYGSACFATCSLESPYYIFQTREGKNYLWHSDRADRIKPLKKGEKYRVKAFIRNYTGNLFRVKVEEI